ncbi:MAG: SOS response-associated peptidase [Propionicimonas sp.]|uniref:SOS response-associated peptidase n=1 Tax=Propionicimonas sp. TaxID=1955623 RepID=UPI002B1F9F66|nr:SOS response-associated peptidase [Propionicimonas sp.]MEA4944121.1 SOS response-associated peptidase [Propionicimonas sp.]MEA5052156.1 SOS response-associated peptidase [Propionicimonas sp.]MEA5118748.1 SOS response-associated peptidase [Propionicimonas sp.]
MCGRYASSASNDLLAELFEVEESVGPLPEPSWNVAPTDAVPAVVERPAAGTGELVRKLVALRWGLVPSWSKDPGNGARMINARFETVAEKPAFRRAFAARRCLLPADGYYEWYTSTELDSRGKPVKQPFFIHPSDGGLLAMAGLYEFWKSPAGEWLASCTVITTQAADALGRIHDRMPMVVPPDAWGDWLDPRFGADPRGLLAVPGAGLEAHLVSRAVNNVANNTPDLVLPVPDADRE